MKTGRPRHPPGGEITSLLRRLRQGEGDQDQLYRLVYGELLKLARSRLAGVAAVSLDGAELVHEAYLRLARQGRLPDANRHAFYAYAASVMNSVLIDALRERQAAKRGGGLQPVTLVTGLPGPARQPDLARLSEALEALASVDARARQVVDLRYFGGLTLEETAAALALSAATVKRDWSRARAFLLLRLES